MPVRSDNPVAAFSAVRLCELEAGKRLWTSPEHQERVTFVAFSSDSRLGLSGSDDGTLQVYEFTWK
jgi:WD40 repeat protein